VQVGGEGSCEAHCRADPHLTFSEVGDEENERRGEKNRKKSKNPLDEKAK